MEIDPKIRAFSVGELFESAPCGLLAMLPDGTIVQVNETFVAQTGQTRDWLLSGKRFAELLTIPGRIYHDTHFHPLLQMQGAVKEIAFDLTQKDRPPLSVLINALITRDTPPGSNLTLLAVSDATDRRTYEREILQAKRHADEATEAERAARELAERAARIKDEFLAMVSHELRTPLNAILGWAQMLQKTTQMSLEQQEGLSIIERNARVQAELIDDLLDMSRIMSGKMRLAVQSVELAAVIEDAMQTVRPAVDAKGIRLQKVLDPAVIVSGDPNRLQQVFWNLFNNAVKFTPKGGTVRVVMQRVNSHIEVSVTDTGQGMSKEFIAHAFERFRQSDSGETQKTRGLGLGLSIVKSLVEMHGGTIRAASEGPDKGSTFVIDLPLTVVHPFADDEPRVHPHAAVTPGDTALRSISLSGVKVLVVDDEPDARELVRRVLSAAGAKVTIAASSAEALTMLELNRPDVLVSDVGLPGEDGYELIRKIRMLGDGVGGVKALALTAFARLEDRTRAMLSGYQMHLTKPADSRELVIAVATLAGRR